MFSMAELERAFAQTQELNDDELNRVTGGQGIDPDSLCWKDYYCFAVLRHDDDGKTDRPCWSDYTCVVTYNVEEDRHKTGSNTAYPHIS